MTEAAAATTTESAPFSTEEMREATSELDDRDHARAVATAAALERATKWVADWVPGTDGAAYNSGRAEGRADLCAALRAVLDPADTHRWNQDGLLGEVRRLVSLAKAPVATADLVERPAHYTQGDPKHKVCATCDARGCSDCDLARSGWRQREDVAVQPSNDLEDSPLRDCRTCDSARCSGCVELSDWRARYQTPKKAKDSSPVDYYDGDACMDACRLACRGRSGIEGHFIASAIQYLWRSGRKGPALPDLLKARDMVDRLVREIGGGK